ncbi:argininosuccinate synthase, partial [Enterobacter intestinihominis]
VTLDNGVSLFSRDDLFGQLTMRNLEITDTVEKVFKFFYNGVLSANSVNGLPLVYNLEHSYNN